MSALIFFATASSWTVNANVCCRAPGTFTIASSPSQVLQTQPRLENFWTNPARWPDE